MNTTDCPRDGWVGSIGFAVARKPQSGACVLVARGVDRLDGAIRQIQSEEEMQGGSRGTWVLGRGLIER